MVEQFSLGHSFLRLKLLKLLSLNHAIFFLNSFINAEAAAAIPNGGKRFFAKGTANFINGLVNLLYNDLKIL